MVIFITRLSTRSPKPPSNATAPPTPAPFAHHSSSRHYGDRHRLPPCTTREIAYIVPISAGDRITSRFDLPVGWGKGEPATTPPHDTCHLHPANPLRPPCISSRHDPHMRIRFLIPKIRPHHQLGSAFPSIHAFFHCPIPLACPECPAQFSPCTPPGFHYPPAPPHSPCVFPILNLVMDYDPAARPLKRSFTTVPGFQNRGGFGFEKYRPVLHYH